MTESVKSKIFQPVTGRFVKRIEVPDICNLEISVKKYSSDQALTHLSTLRHYDKKSTEYPKIIFFYSQPK
jgi:hypothetical protein